MWYWIKLKIFNSLIRVWTKKDEEGKSINQIQHQQNVEKNNPSNIDSLQWEHSHSTSYNLHLLLCGIRVKTSIKLFEFIKMKISFRCIGSAFIFSWNMELQTLCIRFLSCELVGADKHPPSNHFIIHSVKR
jgi:hypothetical protein